MKVCVASAGRFHGFDLAEQIERLGYLERFYTGYPPWKVSGLPREKTCSFPYLIAPMMMFRKWGLYGLAKRMNWPATYLFDLWMSHQVVQCDIFHFLSSFGLRAQRRAKERYGAVSICDRGSSHIVYQEEILAEEYAIWGLPHRPMDQRIVEQELQEYEECDRIFIPSDFVYRSFLQKGVPKEKLVKVSYGVDLRLFSPTPKEDDVFRVIYVGGMRLEKGIQYLLKALAPLQLPRFEVWLIGWIEPEIRPFLAEYDGRFRFFGYVPKAKLYKYYSQASVFVIASVQEGLATVQAQAMACGLPVIATTHTGAEDLFTDGVEGFIVPVRDPEAIREKVAYLYTHPDVRDEMGNAAMERVRILGGWRAYGQRVLEGYQSVLGLEQPI